MKFPADVLKIVDDADRTYPDDIDAAVEVAEQLIRALPCFKDVVNALVTSAVRSLVHDTRHARTVRIKRENGGYGAPAKTTQASAVVKRVYDTVYDMRIAGKCLGNLTGQELGPLADSMRAVAGGSLANAYLLEWLKPKVAIDKTVRQSVGLAALKKAVEEARKKAELLVA